MTRALPKWHCSSQIAVTRATIVQRYASAALGGTDLDTGSFAVKTSPSWAVLCCAVPCLLLSACSSSSTSSSGGSKGSIHIGIVADVTPGSLGTGEPEAAAAAKAAVKAIDAAGGINGKNLVLTVCDAKGDANQTTACARSLAADKSIVALTGSAPATASLEPVLEATNLTDFGDYPVSPGDSTSRVSFPLVGGPEALLLGAGTLVTKYIKPTPKKVGFAYLGIPGFGAEAGVVNTALKSAGVGASVTKSVSLPPGAPDISSQVASSTSGVDAVVIGDSPSGLTQYVTTAAKLNIKKPIVLGVGLGTEQISTLGATGNGVYQVASYRPATKDFAGGRQFLTETAHAGSGFTNNEASLNAWLAVHVLADQLKKMTTITRASVYAEVNKTTSASTYGFTSSLNFAAPSKLLGGKFPRLHNGAVFLAFIQEHMLRVVEAELNLGV